MKVLLHGHVRVPSPTYHTHPASSLALAVTGQPVLTFRYLNKAGGTAPGGARPSWKPARLGASRLQLSRLSKVATLS